MADPAARKLVDVIATHQYDQSYTGSVPLSPPSTPETPYPLAKEHGREFWQTEVSFIGGRPDASIKWGSGTALLIHNAMVGGEVNAWVWWVFLNHWIDNEGLTDAAGDSFVVHKRLWAFGNYSRFVRPGWVMIGTTNSPAKDVFVTAFRSRSGNRFAVVAINNTDAPVTLQMRYGGFTCGSLTPWVTDAVSDLATQPAVKGPAPGSQPTLGAASVTTFTGSGRPAPAAAPAPK